MNLNHFSIAKYTLFLFLTFLCIQLSAVKPSGTFPPAQKQELEKQNKNKKRKGLSFKQKASLFLLKKLTAKKAKQASKNPESGKDSRIAFASFVVGILGILMFPLALVLSILGVPLVVPVLILMTVLGIMAVVLAATSKKKMKLYPDQYAGKTMSTIGLVIGIIILSFWLAIFIAWLDAIGFIFTPFA